MTGSFERDLEERPGLGPASGAAGLAALRAPDWTFALSFADRGWEGWCDAHTAVVARSDGTDVEVLAVDGLPTRLARLVELGPRPRRRVPELVLLETARLEEHLRRGEAVDEAAVRQALDLPAEAPDDLAAAIGALPVGARRWRLTAPAGVLDVLDTECGLWAVMPVPGSDRSVLATSATELVWAQLVALAHRDDGFDVESA